MMFIIVTILILLIPFLFIRKAEYKVHEKWDAILVLGCPCNADGSLSFKQRERLETCACYVNRYGCTRVLISGGAVHNAYVEAEVMKAALQASLSECVIDCECKARNTFQNFKFTKEQFDVSKILVITSSAHCRRAFFFARKFFPHAYMAKAYKKDPWKDYIIEYLRLWNVLYWEVFLKLFKS